MCHAAFCQLCLCVCVCEVMLVCGVTTEIRSVTEPQTCQYMTELASPLVCHPDSMLVYPTLSSELQDVWDELEGLRLHNILTQQVLLTKW